MPSKRSRAWKRRKLAEESAQRLRGIDPDARLVAEGVRTGRWPSSPNMQNLPRAGGDRVDALAYALQALKHDLKNASIRTPKGEAVKATDARVTLLINGEEVEAELVSLDFEETPAQVVEAAERLAGTYGERWRVLNGTLKGQIIEKSPKYMEVVKPPGGK